MSSFVHLIDQRRLIGPGGSTTSGEIAFYYTGTSVLAPVYLNSTMTVPAANPITVAAGEIVPSLFLDRDITYRRVITYSDGSYDEQDPLGAIFTESDLGLPVGSIIDFCGSTPPEGFFLCDGSEVNRTTYAELFTAIGTTYGAGNGTTTFNLPDVRGRVLAGKDNMGGSAASRLTAPTLAGSTLGASGGAQTHVLGVTELPAHDHTGTVDSAGAHTHFVASSEVNGTGSPVTNSNSVARQKTLAGDSDYELLGASSSATLGLSSSNGAHTHDFTSGTTGSDAAHNNVQPTLVVNKIIKAVRTEFLSLIGLVPDFTNKANAEAIGIAPTDTDMGTFTGYTISDNTDAKTALQELETAHETFVADLASTANGDGAGLSGYLYSSTYAAGTVGKKLQQSVDLDDFAGATDHAKLTAAVAFCKLTGIALNMPSRTVSIDTDLGSITLEEVTLVGEHVLDGATGTLDKGCILSITGTTNSPFKVRRGVTVTGLGIYYPAQTDSASPTAYPVTFKGDYTNGAIQFVNLSRNVIYNAYRFVDFDDGTSGNLGHIEIIGNYICALNRGVYISRNLEHVRIERNNFTFGFWLAATEPAARAYMRANAIAVQIDYSDGVEIKDNLIFGHLVGVAASATGLVQLMDISTNKFDQVRYSIKADGAGNFDGLINGNTFNSFNDQDHTLQGQSIVINTAGSARETITIIGNSFKLATEDHISTSGNNPTRDVVVSGNNFVSWAAYKAAGAYGALSIGGALTNVTATGNRFMGGNSAAYSNGIEGSFNTLESVGNRFEGCLAPINVTVNHATLTGNRSFTTGGATSDVISATSCIQTGNAWDKSSGTSTKPAFLVRKSASQTFNSGTATDAVWGTESFDKGSNFASNVFTAPQAGRYRFELSLMHDNTGVAGDRWQILLVTSGGTFSQSYKMIGDYNSVGFSAEVELAIGATAKVQVQRVGGAGDFVTFNDGNSNYFSGTLVE